MLQKFKYVFPYITTFLIFLGSLRLIIFYSFFNINIIDFLEFPEILTSFLDNTIGMALVYSLFYFIAESFMEPYKINEAGILRRKNFIEGSIKHRIKDFLFDDWLITVVGIFLFTLVGLNDIIKRHFDTPFLIVFIILIVLSIFFRYVERVFQFREEYSVGHAKPLTISTIIYFGSWIVLTTIFNTLSNAQSIKYFNGYKKVNIAFIDSTFFKTDSNNFYIGKTSNYVFIYHKSQDSTEVYKVSDIKRLSFRPK